MAAENTAVPELQPGEATGRPAAPPGRGARVDEQLTGGPLLEERHMAVLEDHEVGCREAAGETTGPGACGAGVVDDGDPDPLELDLEQLGQLACELEVVVPEHGVDPRHRPELLEGGSRGDITGMDDGVAVADGGVELARQGADATPQVRVGDDEEPHRIAPGALGGATVGP